MAGEIPALHHNGTERPARVLVVDDEEEEEEENITFLLSSALRHFG